MLHEFEHERSVNPTEREELTPKQKIVEHIKDAKLKSVRFQAFEDYVSKKRVEIDLEKVSYIDASSRIRKRMDKVFTGSKYLREYEAISKLGEDYNSELTREISDPRQGRLEFYKTLWDIRQQEVERKTQEFQTAGFFNRFYQRFKR